MEIPSNFDPADVERLRAAMERSAKTEHWPMPQALLPQLMEAFDTACAAFHEAADPVARYRAALKRGLLTALVSAVDPAGLTCEYNLKDLLLKQIDRALTVHITQAPEPQLTADGRAEKEKIDLLISTLIQHMIIFTVVSCLQSERSEALLERLNTILDNLIPPSPFVANG